MTKKELIEEAKALGIKGYSKMNVKQLAYAIQDASDAKDGPIIGSVETITCPVCTRTHPHQH